MHTTLDKITGQKATRREWMALAILIIPTLLVSMDMTVTYLALPILSAALKPGSAQLLWITDIFGFMEAGFLIVMGSLGDRIGLKKLLLTGAFAFTAASILAACSTSAPWLITARAIMGIAGATILPTVLSLIRNMFPIDTERTFAMGLYTTCFSAGTMLGPIIGGFLLSHFWWGSIFLMPIPLILLLILAAPALLPEFKDTRTQPIDITSATLLVAATLPVIYGIKDIAQNGVSWIPLLYIIAGATLTWPFIKRQKHLPHPLVDLQLFACTKFKAALTSLFVALFSWSGIFLFIGQYLQSVLGLSAFHAGLWMLPAAGGSIILCMLAPAGLTYFSRGAMITGGLFMLATGTALLYLLTTTSLALLITSSVFMSAGCGITVTLGIDLVVASAPPKKAGAAAGISETSTTFGSSLGIACLGSIWTAFYRKDMSIPGAAIHTARNTIGGAVAEADRLHNQELLHQARQAFTHSLHLTTAVCTVIVITTILFIASKFNHHQP